MEIYLLKTLVKSTPFSISPSKVKILGKEAIKLEGGSSQGLIMHVSYNKSDSTVTVLADHKSLRFLYNDSCSDTYPVKELLDKKYERASICVDFHNYTIIFYRLFKAPVVIKADTTLVHHKLKNCICELLTSTDSEFPINSVTSRWVATKGDFLYYLNISKSLERFSKKELDNLVSEGAIIATNVADFDVTSSAPTILKADGQLILQDERIVELNDYCPQEQWLTMARVGKSSFLCVGWKFSSLENNFILYHSKKNKYSTLRLKQYQTAEEAKSAQSPILFLKPFILLGTTFVLSVRRSKFIDMLAVFKGKLVYVQSNFDLGLGLARDIGSITRLPIFSKQTFPNKENSCDSRKENELQRLPSQIPLLKANQHVQFLCAGTNWLRRITISTAALTSTH